MIVDAHVHRYPSEVYQDPVGFAHSQDEKRWLSLVSPEDRPSIQGWADRNKMITDMDQAGVDKAVLLGWYWERPETCSLQNAWHLEWTRQDPDRFIAFAAAHPLANDNGLEELKAARDAGFRGMGEIHPVAQGFSMRDPRWLAMVEFAIESNWPINFHVNEPLAKPLPGRRETPFEDFHWLAETYPELKIILAHWGGLLPFHELNRDCRKAFANVWYDVAASPLLYDKKVFRAVVDVVGPDKILYGSDYPLRLYPSSQKEPDFTTFLDEIQKSGLTIDELAKVLGENLALLID
tara:strand:- start:2868 stop:3746 length:879 start_codon:yes stop_codon:yes gene_type:complete